METTELEEFESQIIDLLPNMRVWALALIRNTAAADDLVQDVAMKASAGRESFVPGTNFKAWIHRIMVNHFIASIRGRREFISVDDLPDIPIAAEQPAKVDLDRLSVEFDRLPNYLKDALRQVAIDDRSYEDISASSGCAIGR